MPTLSVVIPHWPIDAQTEAALHECVASFPPECVRLVVVNEGTGYGRNVNLGLRLAKTMTSWRGYAERAFLPDKLPQCRFATSARSRP